MNYDVLIDRTPNAPMDTTKVWLIKRGSDGIYKRHSVVVDGDTLKDRTDAALEIRDALNGDV